jgi:hypothetical protein
MRLMGLMGPSRLRPGPSRTEVQSTGDRLATLTSVGMSSCSSGLVQRKEADGRHASQREIAGAFVPKGLQDSAWGFNPRCQLNKTLRPEGAVEPEFRVYQD